MKRTFLFTCVVLLAVSFIGYTAWADPGIAFYHVAPPTHIEALRDFNITPEVNALRAAKAKRDLAIKNSDGSPEAIKAALEAFKTETTAQFHNAWLRRRAQYAHSRVVVTLLAHFNATMRHGVVRIDRPSTHLKPVTCGYRELCRCEPYKPCNFDLHFERIENNGFTYVASSNPQWKPGTGQERYKYENSWAHYLLQADFAYTDAYLNALADRDIQVLKDRIMMAL